MRPGPVDVDALSVTNAGTVSILLLASLWLVLAAVGKKQLAWKPRVPPRKRRRFRRR
jgi:hypothetical protein